MLRSCENAMGYYDASWLNTVMYCMLPWCSSAFMKPYLCACSARSPQIGILLSLNHSCAWIRIIIPKDSFCPHSLMHRVTHFQWRAALEKIHWSSSALRASQNPREASPARPPSQTLWLWVSLPLKQDVLKDHRGHWGCISNFLEWYFDVANLLTGCAALQQIRPVFPVYRKA